MRIGIDARMYGSAHSGLGRYVEQLIENLLIIDNQNEYVLFLRQKEYESLNFENRKVKKVLANVNWYSLAEQIFMPGIIKNEKVDLMHFPHWNVPLMYSKPFVLTIHDLIMYHYPRRKASTHNALTYYIKDKLHRLVIRRASKKAKKILTPSVFSKNDIHKTLKVPTDKIHVTHLAPAPIKKIKREVRDKDNLNTESPYVLYVGNAYPHKNLDNLLKAWEIFNKKYSDEYKLLLIGKKNYFYNQLIEDSSIPKKSVRFVGYVNDCELQKYYEKASLYVFPSLYEGFGYPPLEAMLYNIPVVSSDASCLKEILQDSVIYFNPKNTDQIAEKINYVLTNNDVRIGLKQKGQQLLLQYSGQKMAKQTLEIYQNSKL